MNKIKYNMIYKHSGYCSKKHNYIDGANNNNNDGSNNNNNDGANNNNLTTDHIFNNKFGLYYSIPFVLPCYSPYLKI